MKFLTFQNLGLGFVAIMFALFGLSILTTPAKADVDSRPIQVQETEQSIKRNQAERQALKPALAECATIQQRDKLLETDNARLVGRLEVFGFAFDWPKLAANKVAEPSPL